jgi:hypothetical protein
MAAGTNQDFAFLQKIIYADGTKPGDALVRDKPAMLNTPHKKDFASGKGYEIPAPYATPQGASAAIATAAANASPSKGSSFTVPQTTYFAQMRLDHQLVKNAMEATTSGVSAAAFVDQMKYETDGVEETIGVEMEKQIFGTGAGYRGVIGTVTIGANTTILLQTITDAVLFEVNMWVVLATTATGAIRSGGTTNKAMVTAVNTKTGLLTFTGQNFTTLFGTAATGDFIFREGDAQNAGAAKVGFGLADWNPSTDPTATLFCGVDRSVYPSRLAGVRYDGTTDSLQTVFIRALAQARTEVGPGFKKGTFYIHPLYGAALRSEYEAKRIVDFEKATTYDMGVDAFKVDNITFIEAALCPYGRSKMVADGAFVRASCGDQPDWAGMSKSDQFWLDRDNGVVKGLMCNYGNFGAWHVNQLMDVALPAI